MIMYGWEDEFNEEPIREDDQHMKKKKYQRKYVRGVSTVFDDKAPTRKLRRHLSTLSKHV